MQMLLWFSFNESIEIDVYLELILNIIMHIMSTICVFLYFVFTSPVDII